MSLNVANRPIFADEDPDSQDLNPVGSVMTRSFSDLEAKLKNGNFEPNPNQCAAVVGNLNLATLSLESRKRLSHLNKPETWVPVTQKERIVKQKVDEEHPVAALKKKRKNRWDEKPVPVKVESSEGVRLRDEKEITKGIKYGFYSNIGHNKGPAELTDEELIYRYCDGFYFTKSMDKETALKEAPTLRKYLIQCDASKGFDIVDWPDPRCLPFTGLQPADRSPESDQIYMMLARSAIQRYNLNHGKDLEADQLVQVNHCSNTHYYITFNVKGDPTTFRTRAYYQSDQDYQIFFCRPKPDPRRKSHLEEILDLAAKSLQSKENKLVMQNVDEELNEASSVKKHRYQWEDV